MERYRHIMIAIGALAAASLTAAPAMAKGYYGHKRVVSTPSVDSNFRPNRPVFVRVAQNSISAAKAKSIARAQVKDGEVVDISRKGNIYSVRVIAKNGRVVDVLIDANTGRVKR